MTDKLSDAQREALIKSLAIARLGTPADVAEAVAFLASPASSWVTGVNLVADNGFTKRVQL